MQDYLSAANNKDNLVVEMMLVCLRRVHPLPFIKQRRKSEEIVETTKIVLRMVSNHKGRNEVMGDHLFGEIKF